MYFRSILLKTYWIPRVKKEVTPPKNRSIFFLGGGKLFLGRFLRVIGSSQHYIGMFRSSIGPVKKICGSAGGSSAAQGRPESFSLPPKQAKIAGIRHKLAGSTMNSFWHVVLTRTLQDNAFCDAKKFYRMLRRPPAIYERLKNGTFLQKLAKMNIFCKKIAKNLIKLLKT